jgi:hypothetical protein
MLEFIGRLIVAEVVNVFVKEVAKEMWKEIKKPKEAVSSLPPLQKPTPSKSDRLLRIAA